MQYKQAVSEHGLFTSMWRCRFSVIVALVPLWLGIVWFLSRASSAGWSTRWIGQGLYSVQWRCVFASVAVHKTDNSKAPYISTNGILRHDMHTIVAYSSGGWHVQLYDVAVILAGTTSAGKMHTG